MVSLLNENITEGLNETDISGSDLSGVNVNNVNLNINETSNVLGISETNTSVSATISSIINNFFYGNSQTGANQTGGTNQTGGAKQTNTTQNGSFTDIFSLSNILFLIWFLLIYLVIFYLIKSFYKDDTDPFKEKMALSRGIDIFIFGLLIILIIYSYWSLSEEDKRNLIGYIIEWTHGFYNNPNTLFECLVFILLFYLFIYLFGVPMTKETRPVSIYFIEQKLWILLISVIIVNFFIYVLNIPIVDLIFGNDGGLTKAWYSLRDEIKETDNKPTKEPENKPVKPKEKKPEVFNISNNLYTYSDAKAVCKAFNAELATVDQLNTAYDEGAEWCVNSWSANQQVLYPTQKATYDRLQKIKGQENTCGRTGVNGGYVKDTSMRFGVNCYGIKPSPSEFEKNRMKTAHEYVAPKSKEDMILEAKVNYWKNNKDDYMTVSPFNNDKWSYESA
jgi:hypothetical protein